MIIYLPSWSQKIAWLFQIESYCWTVYRLRRLQCKSYTKKYGEAPFWRPKRFFFFSTVDLLKKKIPYFLILSQRKVSRLYRELTGPSSLTFKEQITSSSFKVKVMIIRWRQKVITVRARTQRQQNNQHPTRKIHKFQPRSQSSSAISDVTSPVKLVGKVCRGRLANNGKSKMAAPSQECDFSQNSWRNEKKRRK